MPALVTESQLLAARMGLGLPVVVRDIMTINNITLYEISHTDYLAIVEHALVSMPTPDDRIR